MMEFIDRIAGRINDGIYEILHCWNPHNYPDFPRLYILEAVQQSDGEFENILGHMYRGALPAPYVTTLRLHKILLEMQEDKEIAFLQDVPRHHFGKGEFGRCSRWVTRLQQRRMI